MFMLVFGFAPILVIDEKLNPIAAYKRSAIITKGTRISLLYIYGAAFLLAFMALAPWTLAPGAVGTGMFYAVATLIFCAFSVLSAAVTRALQAREKGVGEERLTQDSLSV
jgi:membrane protein implicated in regulation of membrane protease activity